MTPEVTDETIDDQQLGDKMLAEATVELRRRMDLRWHVIAAAALVPSLGAGFYFHGGANAVRIVISIVISYACLAVVEGAFSAVRNKRFRVSRSFVLTGLLLALLLPPGTPFWMVALGAVFGAV
ncbi:MAG: RnfABCDGE type electron transport complex subunit D, partial [Planctomycetota bacterium]